MLLSALQKSRWRPLGICSAGMTVALMFAAEGLVKFLEWKCWVSASDRCFKRKAVLYLEAGFLIPVCKNHS